MRKNTIIVKGKAIFANTRKPVKENAKFHAGEYKIQIYDTVLNPKDVETEEGKLVTRRLVAFQLIDGARYDNILTIYSKNYPFKLVDSTGTTGTSDEYNNLENGQEVAVAITTYENRFGKQLTVQAVKVKSLEDMKPESLASLFEEDENPTEFVEIPTGMETELPFN